jgi:hypothetical protein
LEKVSHQLKAQKSAAFAALRDEARHFKGHYNDGIADRTYNPVITTATTASAAATSFSTTTICSVFFLLTISFSSQRAQASCCTFAAVLLQC